MDPDLDLSPREQNWTDLGTLWEFYQRDEAFIDGYAYLQQFMPWEWTGLAAKGFVFFPNDCYNVDCHLNVILHGCMNGEEIIADSLVKNSGFAEYAVTNSMILLFPQAEFHYLNNIEGCWAVSDTDFKNGPGVQNKAIMKMIKRLTEHERGLYNQDLKEVLDARKFSQLIETSILNRWSVLQTIYEQWAYFRGISYTFYSKPIQFVREMFHTITDVNMERFDQYYKGKDWQGVSRIYNCSAD